jgi:NadR type nicotinamide-nucleotide adenylyltransferase
MYKIAILGPESTGKSELAKALATYYKGEWVPEYAREYVEKLGRKYNYDDVCHIAATQLKEIDLFENKTQSDFVFFDTELIITKIWFEYCFGEVPQFLTNAMEKPAFDFYLLCDYDLEWIPDPVREHGDDRAYFFNLYKEEIEKTQRPFAIVSGTGEERVLNAINAIENYFKR